MRMEISAKNALVRHTDLDQNAGVDSLLLQALQLAHGASGKRGLVGRVEKTLLEGGCDQGGV